MGDGGQSCGSNLSRQCIINHLSKVHSWTGGGLHAPADPADKTPPQCGMVLKLTGTAWSQFFPKTIGQFDCNAKYEFKISQADWGTSLGSDRIATRFLPPDIIKPQSQTVPGRRGPDAVVSVGRERAGGVRSRR